MLPLAASLILGFSLGCWYAFGLSKRFVRTKVPDVLDQFFQKGIQVGHSHTMEAVWNAFGVAVNTAMNEYDITGEVISAGVFQVYFLDALKRGDELFHEVHHGEPEVSVITHIGE